MGKYVECTACGLQLQVRSKYDLQRHWETKHKDRLDKNEKPTSKIVAGDTETMIDFLARKKKLSTKDGGEMVEEENKADSMVTKKLRMEQPSLPFFS